MIWEKTRPLFTTNLSAETIGSRQGGAGHQHVQEQGEGAGGRAQLPDPASLLTEVQAGSREGTVS